MVLRKQVISIPFAKGVNEKTSSHHLQPGELASLKNGVFKKNGEIEKRDGYRKQTFQATD